MRMHTIPQNVTAYEDRIVGMLVGKQFVYLAIAGVTIFVLMSAQIGPLLIRLFFSILIAAFAAAMALYKPDDRNFDSIFTSYIQAMFGPTEWIWQKDILPLHMLRAITTDFQAPPVSTDTQQGEGTVQHQNLQRVSRYQSFLSQKEEPESIDEDVQFIEQLNFSEPIPDKALAAVESAQPAPPMLTKNNFNQVRTAAAPPPKPVSFPHPKPISAIAGSSKAGITFSYNGEQQSISRRSNQRTNRSLSRHMISSGIVSLPVRGEMQLDISSNLKNDLTSMQTRPPVDATVAAVDLAGQPIQSNQTTQPAMAVAPTPTPTPPQAPPVAETEPDASKKSETIRNAIDYGNDWSKHASIRQQIDTLGQSLSYSGITNTKGISMSDNPNQPSDNQPQNDATQPLVSTPQQGQGDPVKIVPPSQPQAGNLTPDVEQQLEQVEKEVKQQMTEIPPTPEKDDPAPEVAASTNTPPALSTADNNSAPAPNQDEVLLNQYKSEIDRLTAYNKEVEARAQQAEAALSQMQQTTPSQSAIQEQQGLISKLRTEQQQTTAYTQELQQKLSSSVEAPSHNHVEYAPVPEVPPVMSEPVPASKATAPAEPAIAEAKSNANAQPEAEGQPQDLQARMSAAGMGSAEQITQSSTEQQAGAVSDSQLNNITLTTAPNIINGRVVDAQGQSLGGVIVVVKNAQGESKRALKTNKLGQFVVTTPLANGSYTVEVDKKGLSFDIMKVELNGAVSAPVVISAK